MVVAGVGEQEVDQGVDVAVAQALAVAQIELEVVGLEAEQVGDRGKADAEVVDGDLHAEVAQLLQLHTPQLRFLDDRRLGHLQHQSFPMRLRQGAELGHQLFAMLA